MDHEELKEYNKKQIEEMERHKWIESEKHGRDLGWPVCLEWVRDHAWKFRADWFKGKR